MKDHLHTCHAECPCHMGEEPPRDFLPAEGWLAPWLWARAMLEADRAETEQTEAGKDD